MKQQEELLNIIEEKFTQRFEVSKELHERLLLVPKLKQKSTNFNWLVAASILTLFSFNLLAISKKTKARKEQYIIEQYSTIDTNFTSYE
jgi:hypothetical protein